MAYLTPTFFENRANADGRGTVGLCSMRRRELLLNFASSCSGCRDIGSGATTFHRLKLQLRYGILDPYFFRKQGQCRRAWYRWIVLDEAKRTAFEFRV